MPRSLVKNRTPDLGLHNPEVQFIVNSGPQAFEAAPSLENVQIRQAAISPLKTGSVATDEAHAFGIRYPFYRPHVRVGSQQGFVEIIKDIYIIRANSRTLSETFWLNLIAFDLSHVGVTVFTFLRTAVVDVAKEMLAGDKAWGEWVHGQMHRRKDLMEAELTDISGKNELRKFANAVFSSSGHGKHAKFKESTTTTNVSALLENAKTAEEFEDLILKLQHTFRENYERFTKETLVVKKGTLTPDDISTITRNARQPVIQTGAYELQVVLRPSRDSTSTFSSATTDDNPFFCAWIASNMANVDAVSDSASYIDEFNAIVSDLTTGTSNISTDAGKDSILRCLDVFAAAIAAVTEDKTEQERIKWTTKPTSMEPLVYEKGGSGSTDYDAISTLLADYIKSEKLLGPVDGSDQSAPRADMRAAVFSTIFNLYLRKIMVPYGSPTSTELHKTKPRDDYEHTEGVSKVFTRSEMLGKWNFDTDQLGMDAAAAVPPWVDYGGPAMARLGQEVLPQKSGLFSEWLVNLILSPSNIRTTACLQDGKLVTTHVPCAFEGIAKLSETVFYNVKKQQERVLRGLLLQHYVEKVLLAWKAALEKEYSFFRNDTRTYIGDFERTFIELVCHSDQEGVDDSWTPDLAEAFFPRTASRLRMLLRRIERFFPQVTHAALRKLDPGSRKYGIRLWTSFVRP